MISLIFNRLYLALKWFVLNMIFIPVPDKSTHKPTKQAHTAGISHTKEDKFDPYPDQPKAVKLFISATRQFLWLIIGLVLGYYLYAAIFLQMH